MSFFPLFFFLFWFQWFLILLRRVWHVQCFCRCAIRSKSGNSVWVEPTDYSHAALKWAAATQQFRPFRQSCEANLLTSHTTGSHDIEEIFGTQNWLIMATQCGFAFMLESLGKNWNITNQRTKEKTYWWQLSSCPFDAHLMLWCGMNSMRLVEWPTCSRVRGNNPPLLHDFRKSKATKLTPFGSIWYLAIT